MDAVSFTRIGTFMKASKTKIAAALFLIVLGIVLFPGKKLNAAEESSGSCGDNVTWTLDTDGTLTISGSGAMKDYSAAVSDRSPLFNNSNITKVVIENGITHIGSCALYYCTKFTEISIPDTVTSIGYGAFSSCHSLARITIPKSVKSIGREAFSGCANLESITIPNSVTSIGEKAFLGCANLESITIPNSVTSIGERAFANCTSLTNITIPNSVTYIGSSAFYNCSNLTNITIPNSVTSIGESAFGDCTSLTSVTIPNSVTSIGDYAFEYCTDLTNITIPNSVTSIGDYAFEYCTDLTNITIPNSVTSIGDYTFEYCTDLTNITIPDSVTSIGLGAFLKCSSLTSITIPKSVTSIGASAFSNCSNLASIAIKKSLYEKCKNAFPNISSDKFHFYYDLKYTTDGNGSVTGPSETFDSSVETFTMSPFNGFTTDKVTWSDGIGDPVELTVVNGKYTMPKPSDSFDYNSGTVAIKVFFKKAEYEITFKNYDGTVLEKKKVPEGETPEYTGTITPSKPSAGGYSYEFAGWDTAPVAVTGPATYTATYTRKEIEYKVTFVDDDGAEICSDTVKYHEVPVFNGNTTPVRKETDTHKFTFAGWTDGETTYRLDQGLPQIESDTTFSPVFDPVVKPVYTVGEVKGDGINSDIVIDVHRNVDDENCLTYFLGATIDGTEMKVNEQYTATKGSTIITIKKDFLSTLSSGEHEVTVNFNDGSISAKVTIAAKANTNTSVPSTGEVTGPAAYIGLAFVAAACACGAGVVLLKKRKEA